MARPQCEPPLVVLVLDAMICFWTNFVLQWKGIFGVKKCFKKNVNCTNLKKTKVITKSKIGQCKYVNHII